MSMEKSTYVILGYDLTNHKTEKYDEWKWSKEWEDYTCNQINGEIQLFDDCEDKLFLGYIFAVSGEYEHIDSIQYSIHNFDEAEDRNFDEIEEEVLETTYLRNPQTTEFLR